jgi:transposase
MALDPTTQTRTYSNESTLYMALELSAASWKLASSAGGGKKRVTTIAAWDRKALASEVGRAKAKLGLTKECRVVCCGEAGRDGFSVHRYLESQGFTSIVVNASSMKVERTKRRVKTDRIDAKVMLTELVRHMRGDEEVWSVVRVPTEDQEDRRRRNREYKRLTKERTGHVGRLRSLMALYGIKVGPQLRKELAAVDRLKKWDGAPLQTRVRQEIQRELERLRLVDGQIRELKTQQREEVRAGRTEAARKMAKLERVKAVGDVSSMVLVEELFGWREFRNRREVGALVGLTGSPYNSGQSEREQGISKEGNGRLRANAIELAWMWVRWQPRSDLTQWFYRRYAFPGSTRRHRKVGIVAVARRLLIQLWHWVEHDVVPKGAIVA